MDGVNTAEEQSRPFRVVPKGYRAIILAPEYGAVVPAEQDFGRNIACVGRYALSAARRQKPCRPATWDAHLSL
jgi:hypothetical protein